MIYREEQRTIKGVWNKENPFTAKHHVMMYGESVADVMHWLTQTPRKWSNNASSDAGNAKSKTWDLNAGWAGAETMAKDGWSEGAKDLDARLQTIMPSAGRQARWGYSPAGSSVMVGRFLAGHPNNMRTRRRKQAGSAPVYHIVINGNASCMVNGEQMKNFGCAMVGLIDRLENTGKRVMVDIMYALKEGEARYSCGWNVKKASEPVNLADLAFALAHPAAFRRIGFAMIERGPSRDANSGYGYCADICELDMPDPTPGLMLVDGINHEPGRCNTPGDALRLAVEQINKAAVIAGHATVEEPLIDDEMLSYD